MIIIKGKVQTSEGPIEVDKLTVGMLVIDRGHRARAITGIEVKKVSEVLGFNRNDAILASDAVLLTAIGKRTAISVKGIKKTAGSIQMLLTSGKIVRDTVTVRQKESEGYELTVEDGTNVYVDGYSICL